MASTYRIPFLYCFPFAVLASLVIAFHTVAVSALGHDLSSAVTTFPELLFDPLACIVWRSHFRCVLVDDVVIEGVVVVLNYRCL